MTDACTSGRRKQKDVTQLDLYGLILCKFLSMSTCELDGLREISTPPVTRRDMAQLNFTFIYVQETAATKTR